MEDSEIITKLIISIVIGIILGGEREYRNKSAGLRTIVLICLGSTVFAILSHAIGDQLGGSRIAANVVTGIGFLGAGAIMREGLTISGLTTASTIWVAAALGLAIGLGFYALAWYAVGLCFMLLHAPRSGHGFNLSFFPLSIVRSICICLSMSIQTRSIWWKPK